jgi:hypothetical protein
MFYFYFGNHFFTVLAVGAPDTCKRTTTFFLSTGRPIRFVGLEKALPRLSCLYVSSKVIPLFNLRSYFLFEMQKRACIYDGN